MNRIVEKLNEIQTQNINQDNLQRLVDETEAEIERGNKKIKDSQLKAEVIREEIAALESIEPVLPMSLKLDYQPLKATKSKLGVSRRLLIQELVKIFRLRRVSRKIKSQNEVAVNLEYRLLSVGFPDVNTISNLKRSHIFKLNASVGFAAQFTLILSYYLDQVLPFCISIDQGKYFCTVEYTDTHPKPLQLDENNIDEFLIALATLNYDIAYLCSSQGLLIELGKTTMTLEMLALLCEQDGLGNAPQPVLLNYDLADVVAIHQNIESLNNSPEEEAWDFID